MGINTPVELIAAQTDAVTTKAPFHITQDRVPVTISADALATTEEVDIYFSVDRGTTWVLLQVDGSPVVLTATDNVRTFYGPLFIGVVKDATASACGVYAHVADK